MDPLTAGLLAATLLSLLIAGFALWMVWKIRQEAAYERMRGDSYEGEWKRMVDAFGKLPEPGTEEESEVIEGEVEDQS